MFEFSRVLPEDGLAPMVGDCIFNLRASLDYLITGLVRSTGQTETRQNEFPIYSFGSLPKGVSWTNWSTWWDEDRNGSIAKKLKGTPTETRGLLKTLQPLHGVPQTDPDSHPLALLQDLNNRDKHRSLNLLASRIDITFTDPEGRTLYDQLTPHGTAHVSEGSKSDTQIVTLILPDSEPKQEIYIGSSYDVVFEEDGPSRNRNVVATLASIRDYIDGPVLSTARLLLGSKR